MKEILQKICWSHINNMVSNKKGIDNDYEIWFGN